MALAQHILLLLTLTSTTPFLTAALRHNPDVVVAVLVRNKAHALPYFFGSLENLEYPKDKTVLWIRSDHNKDDSIDMIRTWVDNMGHMYKDVVFKYSKSAKAYDHEKSDLDWPKERMEHVMELKDEAIDFARSISTEYVFLLDADVFFTETRTIGLLMRQNRALVAPMLRSVSDYSNFWGAMSPRGYYESSDRYHDILEHAIKGCHAVPMVFGAVLIDLSRRASRGFAHDPKRIPGYSGPNDDIIAFAYSVKAANENMYIVNTHEFGRMAEPQPGNLQQEVIHMEYLVMRAMKYEVPGLLTSQVLEPQHPTPSKLGFDQIYLVNLDRRPDRRVRSEALFRILGIDATRISAVDGQQIDEAYIEHHGIKFLPNYSDPYYKRPMTMGEIGCFMSHYHIWQDVVENGYKQVVLFEDDLHFIPNSRKALNYLREEIKYRNLEYDLMYIGRKRLTEEEELKNTHYLEGSDFIATVGYTYWTLGYLLTQSGAQKLLAAKPLEKLLPVDEYLPIMFDKHPTEDWYKHFPTRNLIAYTTEPLIVEPVHFRGQPGYISDTEASALAFGDETGRTQAHMPGDNAAEGSRGDHELLANARAEL